MTHAPLLGVSMGDPASIGPEVVVKAIACPEVSDTCRPIVVGDAWVLQRALDLTGCGLSLRSIKGVADAVFEHGVLNVVDLGNVDQDNFQHGAISAMCGQAGFDYVRKVIDLAMRGEIDGTVTGPINKEALNLAGHKFGGHTEIYARYTNSSKYAMLLVEDNLRVIHVSTHVSLREALDRVKKPRIVEAIQLIGEACRKIGIAEPRLAVAGLNPHAGDGGLFGDEEEKEILPAIMEAREQGYDVDGPVPSDTLFPKAIGGAYDGCVAMYHDQGHIPFKIVGFSWDGEARRMSSVRGVNITLGLPIIRTSVDHGTAMEIAGRNIASPDAMVLAIAYAVMLHKAETQAEPRVASEAS
ncbi:MAG: 4-hydroxythreonine-4-phosphate dehydrogenase PdxA [Pseudomonadota bacterium]